MDGKQVNEAILKIAKNNKAVADLVEAKLKSLVRAEQELKGGQNEKIISNMEQYNSLYIC